MRQLTLADVRAHGIPCEPAPAPIFCIPGPGPDGIPPPDAIIACTSMREFKSDEDAFAFLADKAGLLILDTPPVWLTSIAEGQDFRPGTFVKCWWPGAPEERNGRLGDHSDIPFVEVMRCYTLLAGLVAAGKGNSADADAYHRRIADVEDQLTQAESAEVSRRLPILKEWAERCEEGRRRLEASGKIPSTS